MGPKISAVDSSDHGFSDCEDNHIHEKKSFVQKVKYLLRFANLMRKPFHSLNSEGLGGLEQGRTKTIYSQYLKKIIMFIIGISSFFLIV